MDPEFNSELEVFSKQHHQGNWQVGGNLQFTLLCMQQYAFLSVFYMRLYLGYIKAVLNYPYAYIGMSTPLISDLKAGSTLLEETVLCW